MAAQYRWRAPAPAARRVARRRLRAPDRVGVGGRAARWMRLSSGPVSRVVAIAISTMTVNSRRSSTPCSKPMVSTTSSMSPRVFMSAPMVSASCHPTRRARAAATAPPIFPRQASTKIAASSPTSPAVQARDVDVQSGQHEVGREQQRRHRDDRRARPIQRGGTRELARHDEPEREGADDEVDADQLGDAGTRERAGNEQGRRGAAVSPDHAPSPAEGPGEGGPYDDEQREHEQRELDDDAGPLPRARRGEHREDQHDQRPAEHVVHGGGGEDQGAEPTVGHAAIDEDPRQHREGRDRHRRADEQREGQEVDRLAVDDAVRAVQRHRDRDPQGERQQGRAQRDRRGRALVAAQRASCRGSSRP